MEIENWRAKSSIELQDLDCNCNNCKCFVRDVKKTKINNTNEQIVANKIHYGFCDKLKEDVSAIANILLLHTQNCFENRKSN
ncbi:MAG: hypothetical protein H7296_08480 [Bacteroidia bacterium]|nr:hypothetical protein [Bacteroidia bacterium]